MSHIDTASVASRATPNISHRTPKKHHSSRHEADVVPSQRFRVSYQKVTVDVDLEHQFLVGETELTISPLDNTLRQIKLDCRGIQVNSVIVNQRRADFKYDDFLQNEEYMNDPNNPILSDYKYDAYFDSNSPNLGINQHHMIRSKYYPLYSDQNNTDEPTMAFSECSSELTIQIPDSIKLRLQTSNSKASPIANKSVNATPQTINTTNAEKMYTPLNIKINYIVKNSKNGVLFNGGKRTDIPKNRWYCYTYNNDFGCSASSWVPCVDNLYEKPAWDINIVVPKTLDDIGNSKLIGTKAAEKELRRIALEQMDEDEAQESKKTNDDDHDHEDDEEDEEIDTQTEIVVAVPDLVSSRELSHSMDISKKVVNFQFFNPVCAHHLGFAVGAFQKTPMLDLKSGSDELTAALPQQTATADGSESLPFDSANSNKVPTMFYFLPGQEENVLNSTAFLYKVFEFFSKEFSSFPFNSYTVIFLDDFPSETCSFAGMTIASTNLLYPPNMIEPLFHTTEVLTSALAEQYSGVNVLPKTFNDIWCTIGIAQFMSMMFLKRLFGTNHHKFTIKKLTELLCEIDIAQRPLSNQAFRFPVNCDQDLDLIKLKSPLVLFILDKRMTKTDKSFGLYRVIPKIFLQAMSNDLINGNCLSTTHFQKLCEKVAHNRLEAFFQNWVHHPGVPVFRVIQKFNKKRMFIEMSISQMQRSNFNKNGLTDDEREVLLGSHIGEASKKYKTMRFIDEANWYITETDDYDPQHVFVGPVTVRIHETDGSPYEHIMNINSPHSKMDIQYNTKYRRRKKKDGSEEGFEDDEKEKKKKKDKDDEDHKINKFGDVLMTTNDIQNWGLREDEPQNLDDIELDAFEWLRFDADSEWICDLNINLSAQMFESQLRQDRDVEAHYQAVRHFASQLHPTIHSAKLLLRTLLDKRYYYGVRVEAVRALANISKVENDHIGMRYLLRAFKHLFCYSNEIKISEYDELNWREYIPRANNFSDFTDMFIQKAFVEAFMFIKNKDGDAPIEIKRIVLGLLKYNDNEGNLFDDCFYVCDLIKAVIAHVIISNRYIENVNALAASTDSEGQEVLAKVNDENDKFITDAIHELNRCEKMDRWTTSYQQMITKTVLEQKIRLARAGLAKVTFFDLLPYTQPIYEPKVRLVAYEGLILLGGLRNHKILSYYFIAMTLEESNYLKYELNKRLVSVIGVSGLFGTGIGIDDHEFLPDIDDKGKAKNGGNMISIEDGNSIADIFRGNSDDLAKRLIRKAVDKLRDNLSFGNGLKKTIWDGIHSCLTSINLKRNLFDIATILFEARDYFSVTIDRPMDKKLVVKIQAKILPEQLAVKKGDKNEKITKENESNKYEKQNDKVADLNKQVENDKDIQNDKDKVLETNGNGSMSEKNIDGIIKTNNDNVDIASKEASADESSKPTFIVAIKRESRFKIQLPTFKLKASLHHEKPKSEVKGHSRKSSTITSVVSIDLPHGIASVSNTSEQHLKASTNSNSISALSSGSKSKPKPKPKPASLVRVIRSGDELNVHMKIGSDKLKSSLQNRRVIKKILRNDAHLPLRFVRLNIVKKSVEICTDDRFGGLRNILTSHRIRNEAPAVVPPTHTLVENHTKKNINVVLKINPTKWREHLNQKKEKKDYFEEDTPGVTKPMIRPEFKTGSKADAGSNGESSREDETKSSTAMSPTISDDTTTKAGITPSPVLSIKPAGKSKQALPRIILRAAQKPKSNDE